MSRTRITKICRTSNSTSCKARWRRSSDTLVGMIQQFFDIAGLHLSYATIISFMLTYGFPVVWGLLSSLLIELLKKFGLSSFKEKVIAFAHYWVLRLFVASICLGLNLVTSWSAGEAITLAVVLPAFFSYVTASAVYLHLPEPTSKAFNPETERLLFPHKA